MGLTANSISEALFDSMSLLMDKKIETIKFDQTIDATIVDASEADIGKYMVSNGSSTFVAFSTEDKYSNNEAVLVLIPQGNYDNQKMIVGKKVQGEDGPMTYRSPFQQLVDVTNNLITGKCERDYWANESNPYLGCPWALDVPDFKNSDSYSAQGQNGLIWDSGEIYEQGFTRIGLQAQFSTWLGEYDTILGNYGLAIEITFKCLELEDNNTFSKIITFDSDEFFGDVYNFETYYIQENVYDISDYVDFPVVNIKLYAYQRNNFQSTEGLIYPIMTTSSEDFSTVSPNIFIKDPYICLGVPADEFSSDMATILTTDSYTYYKGSAASTGAQVAARTDDNLKHIVLRWIHKDSIKNIIKTVLPNEVPNGYEIRWYRHLLGAPSPDQFAGAHWVRYGCMRQQPDETGEWSLGQFAEVFELNNNYEPYYVYNTQQKRYVETTLNHEGIAANATYDTEHGGFRVRSSNTYIKLYTNIDIMTNEVEIVFQPNVNFQTEQIKAIVVKNEGTEDSPIMRLIAATNILTFTNSDDVRSRATVIDENALAIVFEDEERGNYFLYNRAGQVGKDEDNEVRGLKAVFEPGQTDVYLKANLEQPWTSIRWEFPSEAEGTMIIPATDNTAEAVPANQLIFDNVTSVGFFIKPNLNRNATHNTVKLTVVKDGQEYHAEAQMLFGTAGTSGSDYTIVMTWENGENSLNLSEKKSLHYINSATNGVDTDPTKSALAGRVYLLDQTGVLAEIQADSTYQFDWYKTYIDLEDVPQGEITQNLVYETDNIKYPITYNSSLLTMIWPEGEETPSYLVGVNNNTEYYHYNARTSQFDEVTDASTAFNNGQIVYRHLIGQEKKLKLDFKEFDIVYQYDFEAQSQALAKIREIYADEDYDLGLLNAEYQNAVASVRSMVEDFQEACGSDITSMNQTIDSYLTTADASRYGSSNNPIKYIDSSSYNSNLSGRIFSSRQSDGSIKRKYYYNAKRRAFVKHNNTFIIDPWEEYYEVETYYEPVTTSNKAYSSTQLTICKDYDTNKEGRFIITGNPTINSLYILQVTLTNFGDFDLVARFPIPIKQGDVRLGQDEGRIVRPAFIEGPTEVRYATTGETDFDKNFYKMFISINPTYIDSINTSQIGRFKLIYDPSTIDEETVGLANFYPSLADSKDHKSYSLLETFINPMLYPPGVYFEDTPLYGVQYILTSDIRKNDNTVLVPSGTVLWTQPIYSYQDNYPSTTLNKWNGKEITTDNDTGIMVANGLAAGKKEKDNTFTGVVLGDWSRDDIDAFVSSSTGVYGFNHGAMSYSLKDDGTAFFGKDGRGRIYLSGNKSQIYSAQWLLSQEGMLLDIDDGYIKMDKIGDANVEVKYGQTQDLVDDLNNGKTIHYNLSHSPTDNGDDESPQYWVQGSSSNWYFPCSFQSTFSGNNRDNDRLYAYTEFSSRNNVDNGDYIWYYGIEEKHKNDTDDVFLALIPGPGQDDNSNSNYSYYYKTIDVCPIVGKTYYSYNTSNQTYQNVNFNTITEQNISNYYELLESTEAISSTAFRLKNVYVKISEPQNGSIIIYIQDSSGSGFVQRTCLVQESVEIAYQQGKHAADTGIINVWQKRYTNRKVCYFLLKPNDSLFTSGRIEKFLQAYKTGTSVVTAGDYTGTGKIFRAIGYNKVNNNNITNFSQNDFPTTAEGFFFQQNSENKAKRFLTVTNGTITYIDSGATHNFDPEIKYYRSDPEAASRYITLSVAEKHWPLAIGRSKSVGSRKFKVNWDGQLFAEDGVFSGKITSKEGEIGGWIIDRTMLYSKWHGSDHNEEDGGNGVVLDALTGAIYGAGIFTKRGKIGGWRILADRLYGGNTMLHRTNGITTDVVKIKRTEQVDARTDASDWSYFGGMGYVGAEFQAGENDNNPGVAIFYGNSASSSQTLFKVNGDNLGFRWNGPFLSINNYGAGKRWQISGAKTNAGTDTNLDIYDFQKITLKTSGDAQKIILDCDNNAPYTIDFAESDFKFKVTKLLFDVTAQSIGLETINQGNIGLSSSNNLSFSAQNSASTTITNSNTVTIGGANTVTIGGASTESTAGARTLSGGPYTNSHSSVTLTCGADAQFGIYARFA